MVFPYMCLVYSSMLLGYSAAPCWSCQTGQIKLEKGYHILHHALLRIHKGARKRSRLNNCTMSCVSLAGLDNCCSLTLEAAAFLTILRSPLPCAPAQRRRKQSFIRQKGAQGPPSKERSPGAQACRAGRRGAASCNRPVVSLGDIVGIACESDSTILASSDCVSQTTTIFGIRIERSPRDQ